ncbi:hypothetical protein [Cellulomonas sp.]|uniref:hypothetical protein n=1 Tax=Cellulomonas sp. TaxID=40001 RepID=UPI001B250294|nr:hypothetical protein [Cellulomonas sp.]MBO9554261.1 hypothetical protein [Cellulomonas sp.]
MSNPYAPPEDRPRTPDAPSDAPSGVPPAGPPTPPPAHRYPHDARPGGGPGAPRDDRPTEVAPTDAKAATRSISLARTTGLLVLASVLVLSFPVPWQAASLGFGLAAAVTAIRGLAVALRGRVRGGVPAVLGVLLLVSGMLSLVSASMLVLWGPQRDHQACLAGALTVTAKSQCEAQYRQDIEDWRVSLEERSRP